MAFNLVPRIAPGHWPYHSNQARAKPGLLFLDHIDSVQRFRYFSFFPDHLCSCRFLAPSAVPCAAGRNGAYEQFDPRFIHGRFPAAAATAAATADADAAAPGGRPLARCSAVWIRPPFGFPAVRPERENDQKILARREGASDRQRVDPRNVGIEELALLFAAIDPKSSDPGAHQVP